MDTPLDTLTITQWGVLLLAIEESRENLIGMIQRDVNLQYQLDELNAVETKLRALRYGE